MKKQMLEHLLSFCRKNISKHPEIDNYLHWSFLIDGNVIISRGVNRSITPPRYYGYHHYNSNRGPGYLPKWHSELDAIHRCKRYMGNAVMVNIRMNKTGESRMSMPCAGCRRILKVIKCKKVFFSLENDTWGQL